MNLVLILIIVLWSISGFSASTINVQSFRANRIAISPSVLDVMNQVAALRRDQRVAQGTNFFTAGKKYISVTDSSMTYYPAWFVTNITDWELRPFDGLAFTCSGGKTPYSGVPWDESTFISDYTNLAAMSPVKFTDNFITIRPNASTNMDWVSDVAWSNSIRNVRLLCKAAVIGRCSGLWCDAESGVNNFCYTTAPGHETNDWGTYYEIVKRRGSNWIQAVEQELPYPKIIWAFLIPASELMTDQNYFDKTNRIRAAWTNDTYGLLVPFVNGMLSGITNAQLIDGAESAFTFWNQWQYTNWNYTYISNLFPYIYIETNLLDKWWSNVRLGPSVYPNWLMGRRSTSISQSLTAEERGNWQQHNVFWGLSAGNRYAWDWFEHAEGLWSTNWTTTSDTPYVLPSYYVRSTSNAQYKVDNSLPLGYTSESLWDGLHTRMTAVIPTRNITNLIAGSEPVINATLTDVVWTTNSAFSTFLEIYSVTNMTCQDTELKMTYNANNLYMAFKCTEPLPAGMITNATEDTSSLDSCDNVYFIMQSPTNTDYKYRFVITPAGLKGDALCTTNNTASGFYTHYTVTYSTYASGWTAAALITTTNWQAEASIPWAALGNISPTIGTNILVSVGRYRSQGLFSEYTSWPPTFDLQQNTIEDIDTNFFGSIILK